MSRRAIIYTRVSSDTSGVGRSVSEQETECRALCEAEGWTVADVLTDNDVGASRYSRGERTAYARLEEVLQPGDVLVTWEASRTTRDLEAYVSLRNLCAERSVLWSYSGRTYDLNSGTDRFLTGLDALLSEQEAERTRERLMRSVRSRAAKGRPHSRPPFGYRRDTDPDTGRLLGWKIDPGPADTVREIFARFLAGHTIRSIYRDLAERDVYAGTYGGKPSKWSAKLIRQILRRESYAGLRILRGEIVGEGTWEPIVSQGDYFKAAALLDTPGRSLHQRSDPVHLLSGIAVCGICGNTLKAQNQRKGGTDGAYFCTGMHLRRVKRPVDELVTEVVLGALDDPGLRRRISEQQGVSQPVDKARDLRDRLAGFVDAAAEGRLSPASLARIEEQLLPQIAEVEKRATVAAPVLANVLTHGDLRERWEQIPLAAKREIIRSLVRPVILPVDPGKWRARFDPEKIRIEWRTD